MPFDWSYERKSLYLAEVLVELGQAACRWRRGKAEKNGSDSMALLPCSSSSKIVDKAIEDTPYTCSRHRALFLSVSPFNPYHKVYGVLLTVNERSTVAEKDESVEDIRGGSNQESLYLCIEP